MTPTRTQSQIEISVVIPTYQRSERIAALLRALADQTLAPNRFEVVVVDNYSTDDTSAVVSALIPTLPYKVLLARTESNHGPAAARNLGWRTATTPLLAYLDDDCSPSPEWLEAGLAALAGQPEAGVIQGQVGIPAGISRDDVAYGPPNWEILHIIEGPTPYFEACNIFFRRRAFEVTGGFDESIGWWGEDTAAGWSVLEAGWERGFAPDALVTHPVERRGYGYFVRNGLKERNLVRLAVEHPRYRAQAFWRPWAYRREDAAFVAAVLGLAIGWRFRPALLAALPYLWWRHPSVRRLSFLRLCVQVPLVDAARVAGHLQGSVTHRTLVV
jgi:GT2 family glycosyltransferase